MKWSGKTWAQKEQEKARWHPHFALLPTQMDTGLWVWLENYERRFVEPVNWMADYTVYKREIRRLDDKSSNCKTTT